MLWHGQSVNISLILRRAEYSSEESAIQQCNLYVVVITLEPLQFPRICWCIVTLVLQC